jgi:hypothetical protein
VSEASVSLVKAPLLDSYWPAVERELNTIEHTWREWHTLEELRRGVEHGRIQLWKVGTAEAVHFFAFTQILITQTGRIVQCFLAFGNQIERWVEDFDAVMEQFARAEKCGKMQVVGRQGWTRLLRPHGFVTETVVLTKDVELRSLQ